MNTLEHMKRTIIQKTMEIQTEADILAFCPDDFLLPVGEEHRMFLKGLMEAEVELMDANTIYKLYAAGTGTGTPGIPGGNLGGLFDDDPRIEEPKVFSGTADEVLAFIRRLKSSTGGGSGGNNNSGGNLI